MTSNIASSELPPHWHHQHYASLPTTMQAIDLAQLQTGIVKIVTADHQTAGRGQRGTHWESDAATNLTFSFAFRPHSVKANEQFLLSEVTCLAVAKTLSHLVEQISVKWPNDVYHRDKKISGMLLEHTLSGTHIDTTLVGIGINVNQSTFVSDAPNPISLRQILGYEVKLREVLENFVLHFETLLWHLEHGDSHLIEQDYATMLYRREGFHRYQDKLTGETFAAQLHHVARNGMLHLIDTDRRMRQFAFKEVKFLL